MRMRGSGPVAACCGNHRERCNFGRMHGWAKPWYKDGRPPLRYTFHCVDCDSECLAIEDEDVEKVLIADARVVAVEHGRDGKPVPGGLRYPGTVESVWAGDFGMFAYVRYDDPSRHGSGLDPYDAGTGWRTWDGGRRWRIVPEAAG